MNQEKCLGQLIIVIATFILLTIVSAWKKRNEFKDVISIGVAWFIVLAGVACLWITVSFLVKEAVTIIK